MDLLAGMRTVPARNPRKGVASAVTDVTRRWATRRDWDSGHGRDETSVTRCLAPRGRRPGSRTSRGVWHLERRRRSHGANECLRARGDDAGLSRWIRWQECEPSRHETPASRCLGGDGWTEASGTTPGLCQPSRASRGVRNEVSGTTGSARPEVRGVTRCLAPRGLCRGSRASRGVWHRDEARCAGPPTAGPTRGRGCPRSGRRARPRPGPGTPRGPGRGVARSRCRSASSGA
jgi:hypothetical protein